MPLIEAGEPEAAVVAGSEEKRLNFWLLPSSWKIRGSISSKEGARCGLLRRVTLGHYDTLMQELMRESRGDFKSFLRMEPEMFRDMVDRVALRIEKSQEGRVQTTAMARLKAGHYSSVPVHRQLVPQCNLQLSRRA